MKITLQLFLLTAFSIAIILTRYVQADDAQKIRVAAILPLSGEAASWGEAFRNGMTIAIDKLSEKTSSQLEFIYEDDGLSAKNAVSALNRLLASGNIDVVFNLSSGTSNALAPLTEAKKIPLLAIASDSTVSKGRKYAFNFWVTPEEEVKALLPEATKRGYRRIARINTIQDGILATKNIFDRENVGKLEMVLSEDYPPDLKDFKPFITKLRAKEKEIDAVMAVLLPGQLSVFAKQAREMGIKNDIFGLESFEDANEVKLAGGALLGSWYVNADDGDGSFLETYRERFPEASSFPAANGHDCVTLLAKAIETGTPKSKINEFLATLKDFKGALGTYSASGDQRFTLPAAVKIITKDGFEKVYK